jgi:hypothetical protein
MVLQTERHEEAEATKPKKHRNNKDLQEIKPPLPWNHHSKASSIIAAQILPLHEHKANVISEATPLQSSSQSKGVGYPIPQRPA